jgi:hypothetical protein
VKDATRDKVLEVLGTIIYFNPRIREGCDAPLFHPRFHSPVLIHASARDATVKSYKIGNNFAALFRKFIQKLGIVIFRISIFFRRVRTIFLFL